MHVNHRNDKEYEGFQDIVTYFRIPGNLKDVMVLGFHIPGGITTGARKNSSKYLFMVKDYNSNRTYEYELRKQPSEKNFAYYHLSAPTLSYIRRNLSDVYFRILVHDFQLKEKSVLILNRVKISMVVSKNWSNCQNLDCVKMYKNWRDTLQAPNKTHCNIPDVNFFQIYYKKCTSKYTYMLVIKL
jgi:hypothetical protein